MRRAFHIAIVLLLGYQIADRAAMHFEAGAPGTITCAHGAELVRSDAMRKGFSEAASTSQGEAFMSNCLVSGRGRVGNLIARD
ncbi:MAG TPA: hypothetical protein VNZ04_00210 [Trinickia sp.]|jgi:hypothetical protein|nr:hypothetical protein [Trinickia sp.]